MKIFLIIIIILVLSAMGSARQVSEVVGPYKVDFDFNLINPLDLIVIRVENSTQGEFFDGTSYERSSLGISEPLGENRSRGFTIDIYHYSATMTFDMRSILGTPRGILIPSLYNRTIDNKGGVLAVTSVFGLGNLFSFAYVLDSQSIVIAESNLPWEEGTLQLLKTIHIEKVNVAT